MLSLYGLQAVNVLAPLATLPYLARVLGPEHWGGLAVGEASGLERRNRETKSFLGRAEGQFDCVLLLAVVHHLPVTHGVPVEEVAGLAGRLTRGMVVVEWVGAEDAPDKRFLRGRDGATRQDLFMARLCGNQAWFDRGQTLTLDSGRKLDRWRRGLQEQQQVGVPQRDPGANPRPPQANREVLIKTGGGRQR